MRINCHTHIFNFRSLFTGETLEILIRRLSGQKWPESVIEALAKVLKRLIKGEYLDEEKLMREFVNSLKVSKKFTKYIVELNRAIPADLSVIVHGNADDVAVGALREALRKLGDLITENHDAENQTLTDLLDYMAIGIQPSILHVARILMSQVGDNTAVVALTLDVTNGKGVGQDVFIKQIDATSQAAIAFPGRIFPFISVNPLREDHLTLMEKALSTQGYVGVKLYPSLGYRIDSPEMHKVFSFCQENHVPLLMHCSYGGFYSKDEYRQYSDPSLWDEVLKKYETLKICFGHFGGDDNLVQAAIPSISWTNAILQLMNDHDGVFADIAYHDAPMKGGDSERNYFANVKSLLANGLYGKRILFGSDYFMSRSRIREDSYWLYFENKFTAAEMKQLAEINPRRFLGLPSMDGAGAEPNIERYVDFIAMHSKEVSQMPPAWLLADAAKRHGDVKFQPSPWGVRWSINNDAHHYTYLYFRYLMRPEHTGLSFNEAGGLLVRQLKNWPSEQLDSQNRAGRLRTHVTSFHRSLVNKDGGPGAEPELGVTRQKAEAVLYQLFDNGDTRLADFGEPVDRLYRFKKENPS